MYIVDMIWNNISIKTMLSRYIIDIYFNNIFHYICMMIYVGNMFVLMCILRIDNCDEPTCGSSCAISWLAMV